MSLLRTLTCDLSSVRVPNSTVDGTNFLKFVRSWRAETYHRALAGTGASQQSGIIKAIRNQHLKD